MSNSETIEEQKNRSSISDDLNELVDITTIHVNKELSVQERMVDYINKIKNPYCFKVKDTIVKIKFSDTNTTLEQCLEGYFQSL